MYKATVYIIVKKGKKATHFDSWKEIEHLKGKINLPTRTLQTMEYISNELTLDAYTQKMILIFFKKSFEIKTKPLRDVCKQIKVRFLPISFQLSRWFSRLNKKLLRETRSSWFGTNNQISAKMTSKAEKSTKIRQPWRCRRTNVCKLWTCGVYSHASDDVTRSMIFKCSMERTARACA